MRVGKALEPAVRRLGLPGEREHALRRGVVDDVELMVELGNHPLVGRARIDVGDVFRPRRPEPGERGALPVVAQLPAEPAAVRIEAVEHVGAERHRRIERKFQRIAGLLEHVLRHHPHGVPAHGEQRMEPRVRLLQLEHHGVAIGRRDRGDVDLDRRAPAKAVGLLVGLDGVDHVVGAELDAVAPKDARAQLHRELCEVGIVGGFCRGQRVVPHPVDAALGIDVPKSVHRQLVQAGGLAAGIDRPDVEPASVLDGAFGVLDDQRLVAREIRCRALGKGGRGGQQRDGDEGKSARGAHGTSRFAAASACSPRRRPGG